MTTGERTYPPVTELTDNELRARLARAFVYFIDMQPVASSISRDDLRDHLAFLYDLEQQGRLYGHGPIDFDSAGLPHDVAIVAAASPEDAAAIATWDPLNERGIRRNSVRRHTINEGVACYFARAVYRRAEATSKVYAPSWDRVTLSYNELADRAAGAGLQFIFLDATDKPRPQEDTQTGHDHFIWLRTNEMDAKLMSCGPLESTKSLSPGVWGGGLAVVATSREEAEIIARSEPSGRAGYRALSVHSWTLNYGLAAPIGKALRAVQALP
jgi:uncharacterized protein YciI